MVAFAHDVLNLAFKIRGPTGLYPINARAALCFGISATPL